MLALRDVAVEIHRASAIYPGTADIVTGLVSEVGEVAAALMKGEQIDASTEQAIHIYAECIQVAATALRLALSGDGGSHANYRPTVQLAGIMGRIHETGVFRNGPKRAE